MHLSAKEMQKKKKKFLIVIMCDKFNITSAFSDIVPPPPQNISSFLKRKIGSE